MRRALAIVALSLLVCGSAHARKRRNKLNMPPGWQWPPSAAMREEGRRCLAHLTALGVEWKRAPATRKVTTPIYVPSMEIGGVTLDPIWRKGPFVMDCLLAEALADRGAAALRSAGVEALRFSTIHDVRNIAGTKILSRHALGLAMDVFQIVTDDGQTHVVARDYKRGDPTLYTVEHWVNEAGGFRYLLTPGNDPRHHHDHFHFEAHSSAENLAHARASVTGL